MEVLSCPSQLPGVVLGDCRNVHQGKFATKEHVMQLFCRIQPGPYMYVICSVYYMRMYIICNECTLREGPYMYICMDKNIYIYIYTYVDLGLWLSTGDCAATSALPSGQIF